MPDIPPLEEELKKEINRLNGVIDIKTTQILWLCELQNTTVNQCLELIKQSKS